LLSHNIAFQSSVFREKERERDRWRERERDRENILN